MDYNEERSIESGESYSHESDNNNHILMGMNEECISKQSSISVGED